MELTDKNLEKLIKYKLGLFDPKELTPDDLSEVEELSLTGLTFSRRENIYKFIRTCNA